TFAQLGAGSFVDEVRTLLAREVVVHPTALLVEAATLEAKGVRAPLVRLGLSARARLVTPFHQALGRLRELARGPARHGSCGAGMGGVVRDSRAPPDGVLRAALLRDRGRLAARATRARDRLRPDVEALGISDRAAPEVAREFGAFEDSRLPAAWA